MGDRFLPFGFFFRRQKISFVPNMKGGTTGHAEFIEDFFYGLVEFLMMSAGNVADMHDQRGFLHFFEGGAKRGHQTFRQSANESHSVGKQYAAARRKPQRANGGIERGEHARGNEDFGTAERVEQRRFAGIGVTNQRNRTQGHGVARLTALSALLAHIFDALFDFGNAFADAAAVGFQFLFTGSAYTDAAASTASATRSSNAFAALAGHRGTFASQARKHVVELREFDLQLAFAAAGMARKNIENELGTVDHPALRVLLNVALLNRRQVAIENNQRSVFGIGLGQNFVELAAANERGRISFVAQLKNGSRDRCASAAREFDQLGERFAFGRASGPTGNARRALPGHANQKCAFSRRDRLRGFHRSRNREVQAKAGTAKGRSSI